MSYTQVSDSVVPESYAAYRQALTEAKSEFVDAGVLQRDSELDQVLDGGGITGNMPSWADLADTAANVSIGADGSAITPLNIGSFNEIWVRLSRNQAWGAADLVSRLAGSDPMKVIPPRTAPYWRRQVQLAVIATLAGVFADNAANDSGDYTLDASDDAGGAYSPGVTDFCAEGFIDALHTMGDSEMSLGVVIMHSVVYARAKKNHLIDFVQDGLNPAAAKIPTFLGRRVLVDDGCPVSGQVYTTYLLGAGALKWGSGTPKVPVESYRLPLNAGGGGTEALIERVEWIIHPTGHAYTGTSPNGGPTNAATANNLAHADSWDRRTSERKQVKLASYVTREA